MADLVICYAGDAEAVAGRLAGALSRAGYAIWSEEGASPEAIADRIGEVKAAVVLWSPAARASDWVRAEANYARGQKKLVQASVDEAPPPMPFHPGAVAPLAGWAGEPDHPGWRRIKAEVEGLCGRPASSAPTPAPARVAAPAQRRQERESRGVSTTLIAVLFLLVVAAGAFFWMRSGPPYGSQEPEPAKQAAAPPPKPVAPERTFATPPRSVLPPDAFEPLAPEAEEPKPPAAEPPRPAPRPSGPRINRRNAENMRLFCERAGRGTPQCRTFQRQLRNQSR